jgi:prepilin-type N-terminal cleavage/methylation domain-containing protein
MQKKIGFTLVETMMVLSIIGILFMMFLPNLQGVGGESALGVARQIVGDMRQTRHEAITAGTYYFLEFFPDVPPARQDVYTRYGIFRDAANDVQIDEKEILVHCTSTRRIYRFSYLGGSDNDGTITLDDGVAIFNVNVIAATGRIYEYEE